MEIDFETWKQFVEGTKIITVKLAQPNSLYIEFDTGMNCYVVADTPLEFDFNWLEGYEFLSKPAIKIYVRKLMGEDRGRAHIAQDFYFTVSNMRKRFTGTIAARLDKETFEIVRKVAKERGEDVSDFVRRAIRKELAALSFLSEDAKKALGIRSSTGG